jgi:hypothetical protein
MLGEMLVPELFAVLRGSMFVDFNQNLFGFADVLLAPITAVADAASDNGSWIIHV